MEILNKGFLNHVKYYLEDLCGMKKKSPYLINLLYFDIRGFVSFGYGLDYESIYLSFHRFAYLTHLLFVSYFVRKKILPTNIISRLVGRIG